MPELLESSVVTILPEMRPEQGEPTFASEEYKQLVKRAYRVVGDALADLRAGDLDRLAARLGDTLVTVHVLLSAGTGERPEVLRQLSLDDICPAVAILGRGAGTYETAAWLCDAVAARPAVYHLEITKACSGRRYTVVLTRHMRPATFALEASLRLTQPFRREEGSQALWIDARGRPFTFPSRYRLEPWAHRHGLSLSQSVIYRRIRKNVVAAEAMADPTTYLAMNRRGGSRQGDPTPGAWPTRPSCSSSGAGGAARPCCTPATTTAASDNNGGSQPAAHRRARRHSYQLLPSLPQELPPRARRTARRDGP